MRFIILLQSFMRMTFRRCEKKVRPFLILLLPENPTLTKPVLCVILDWQAPIDKSKLLSRYHDVHPKLLAVLKYVLSMPPAHMLSRFGCFPLLTRVNSKATDVRQWALLFRPPISTWVKGNMTLAGDAAHPMLPRGFGSFRKHVRYFIDKM